MALLCACFLPVYAYFKTEWIIFMSLRPGIAVTDAPLTPAEFSDLMRSVSPAAGEGIAVAVSGGADSLALTLLLGEWCRSHKIALTALTVDHGLRPQAADEARQVGLWLQKYNIPHVILRWQGDKPHSNIQDQARMARYELMGQWCQQNKVSRLFLAHHQGDQAETFLMRLFRGSGVDGLSAMKEQSDFPVALPGPEDITLCRPLLHRTRESLEATLRQMGQPWMEDPGNRNENYMRVKVRNLLRDSDIEGLNHDRMARTAARMGRVQSLLQSLTDDLTHRAVTVVPYGYAVVRLRPLMAAHEEIALRCLAQLIRRIGGGKYAPRLRRLEALYDRLRQVDFPGQTLAGCLVSAFRNDPDDKTVMISREPSAIDDIIDLPRRGMLLWDGRFIIDCTGWSGQVKKLEVDEWRLACQDYPDLEKLKLQKIVRDSLPCIRISNDKVILPDFVAGFDEKGFKAVLKP